MKKTELPKQLNLSASFHSARPATKKHISEFFSLQEVFKHLFAYHKDQ